LRPHRAVARASITWHLCVHIIEEGRRGDTSRGGGHVKRATRGQYMHYYLGRPCADQQIHTSQHRTRGEALNALGPHPYYSCSTCMCAWAVHAATASVVVAPRSGGGAARPCVVRHHRLVAVHLRHLRRGQRCTRHAISISPHQGASERTCAAFVHCSGCLSSRVRR
jgi:hypothetical protein